MLTEERIQYILKKIKTGGAAHVDLLAKELEVSAMTVRRDLAKLAKSGLIERCHGGALVKGETPYQEKQTSHLEAKMNIARTALRFIDRTATVFLDAGTTTRQLALLLSDWDALTIVTTDLEIALLLKETNIRLIVCGGEVQKKTGSVVGFFANQMLSEMRFDVAFIGTACIDQNYTVLTPTTEKAALKRLIVQNSSAAYLVADSSKFYKRAMTCINVLSDYTGVITDKEFSKTELAAIAENNIAIIHAGG